MQMLNACCGKNLVAAPAKTIIAHHARVSSMIQFVSHVPPS